MIMKKVFFTTFLLSFTLVSIFAQTNNKNKTEKTNAYKTETFKVYGNCAMCKKTIEKSLKGVDGVKSAKWDVNKKVITVQYNESAIALIDIHKKIAGVGYDTDLEKANDVVYNKLHGCCQYDRPKKN